MAILHPFRALRPRASLASKVAAVPYDVVSTDEARALAADNPLSFLRVSRAEIELPPGTDPHSDVVYERAFANFESLRTSALVLEATASVYVYRLSAGNHRQTGVAACYALDEYDRGLIKKHERTRRDKEDDRTRHMIALGAQTGPVFLTYRASSAVGAATERAIQGEPLFDFVATDGVRHTVWLATDNACAALVRAFAPIPSLYIADGHHRAASAARAREYIHDIRNGALTRTSPGDEADYTTLLAVAFPDNEVQILPYNRVVRDLGSLSADEFLTALRERFDVGPGPPTPPARGDISMYFQRRWHSLRSRGAPAAPDAVRSLDVSVLQDRVLAPLLSVVDITTDKRIDFVGGGRGTKELETQVDLLPTAVAFSMYPVSVHDLISVTDSGAIMPPKSTWFEPKLRDGLMIHLI